ncbi:MAG: peptidyl-prolyl cis-trans isomerase [Sandaracinus sp.]|nr:peptidyl-prolyl cis-trans isomerase [Sandaracinus sp.]
MRALLREPFVHFLVLGAAFFGLHRLLAGPETADTDVIVVDDGVRSELRDAFEHTNARAPTDEELGAAVERWIDEEVLYREGLARGLDRDDDAVRGRVALSMSYVLSAAATGEPSEDELRRYFEAHRNELSREAAFDFTQVFLTESPDVDARVEDLLAQLRAGATPNGLGDPFSGGRRYRLRRRVQLEEAFGPELAEAVATTEPGSWFATRSRHGRHLVRVDRRVAAEAPSFEEARADVLAALEHERRDRAVREGVAALRARREIVRR